MATQNKTRIDKWLWAVRAYKTRSQANTACASGKIKIDSSSVKPSQAVNLGQVIEFKKNKQIYIFKVLKVIEKRTGADEAQACYEDLSPPQQTYDYQPGSLPVHLIIHMPSGANCATGFTN